MDTVWKHDLFSGPKGLAARISGSGSGSGSDSGTGFGFGSGNAARVKVDVAGARQALQQAVGGGSLSIKGASSSGAFSMNVVQVENLASGTTAADVEVCLFFCDFPTCMYSILFYFFWFSSLVHFVP